MPYLIAHVVRGKPAFDIAECCEEMGTESDPGPWWIIPTSGHRAYPYWSISLGELAWSLEYTELAYNDFHWDDITSVPPAPAGHPDHYSHNAAPGEGVVSNLLKVLGLGRHSQKVERRI